MLGSRFQDRTSAKKVVIIVRPLDLNKFHKIYGKYNEKNYEAKWLNWEEWTMIMFCRVRWWKWLKSRESHKECYRHRNFNNTRHTKYHSLHLKSQQKKINFTHRKVLRALIATKSTPANILALLQRIFLRRKWSQSISNQNHHIQLFGISVIIE